MAYGDTPNPKFQMVGLTLSVDGEVRFNAEQREHDPKPLIFFREVVPAGEHRVQAVARLSASFPTQGYTWKVPLSYLVRTDGTRAVCVDVQLSFVADGTTPLGHRPHLRATEVALAAPAK